MSDEYNVVPETKLPAKHNSNDDFDDVLARENYCGDPNRVCFSQGQVCAIEERIEGVMLILDVMSDTMAMFGATINSIGTGAPLATKDAKVLRGMANLRAAQSFDSYRQLKKIVIALSERKQSRAVDPDAPKLLGGITTDDPELDELLAELG